MLHRQRALRSMQLTWPAALRPPLPRCRGCGRQSMLHLCRSQQLSDALLASRARHEGKPKPFTSRTVSKTRMMRHSLSMVPTVCSLAVCCPMTLANLHVQGLEEAQHTLQATLQQGDRQHGAAQQEAAEKLRAAEGALSALHGALAATEADFRVAVQVSSLPPDYTGSQHTACGLDRR